MIRKLAATLAAAALVAAPVSATAATSAQALSLSGGVRSGAALQDENQIEGAGIGLYIIGAIVIGLAAWGIYELVHDDSPASP